MELIRETPAPKWNGKSSRYNQTLIPEAVKAARSEPGAWFRWPEDFAKTVPQGLQSALKANGLKLATRQQQGATATEPQVLALYLTYEG